MSCKAELLHSTITVCPITTSDNFLQMKSVLLVGNEACYNLPWVKIWYLNVSPCSFSSGEDISSWNNNPAVTENAQDNESWLTASMEMCHALSASPFLLLFCLRRCTLASCHCSVNVLGLWCFLLKSVLEKTCLTFPAHVLAGSLCVFVAGQWQRITAFTQICIHSESCYNYSCLKLHSRAVKRGHFIHWDTAIRVQQARLFRTGSVFLSQLWSSFGEPLWTVASVCCS